MSLNTLIKREFVLEFRQKSTLGSVLLYVTGTIFITALCFKGRKLDVAAWNSLFWIITLFNAVTVTSKSFMKETGGQALFNYLYYSPKTFILAKMIYNLIFMCALNITTFLFFNFFMQLGREGGEGIGNFTLFMTVLLLASMGFATILSLMSAIASKANGGFALMSVLSFPLLLPLIIVVIRSSKQAIDGIEWAGVNFNFIIVLVALNAITAALSYLLFPYLWKE